MTGQILSVLMVPMLRTLAIKARATAPAAATCLDSRQVDLIDLDDVAWPFNDRDPLPRASKPKIYNQEEIDNR